MFINLSRAVIDWVDLAERLNAIREAVDPFGILSHGDVKRIGDAALMTRQSGPIDIPELRLGLAHIAESPEIEEFLRIFAWHFGFGPRPNLPAHLDPGEPLVQVLVGEIRQHHASQPLLIHWAEIHRLLGIYIGLTIREHGAEANLRRAVMGRLTQSTVLQEHWYAHWVAGHCTRLSPRHRDKANDELAQLCWSLSKGHLARPKGYTPAWFAKMLEEDELASTTAKLDEREQKLAASLKSTYRDMPAVKVKRYLADEIVRPEDLPPTDRKLFPPKR